MSAKMSTLDIRKQNAIHDAIWQLTRLILFYLGRPAIEDVRLALHYQRERRRIAIKHGVKEWC